MISEFGYEVVGSIEDFFQKLIDWKNEQKNIIEQYNLEAYEKYFCQWLLGVKNNEET